MLSAHRIFSSNWLFKIDVLRDLYCFWHTALSRMVNCQSRITFCGGLAEASLLTGGWRSHAATNGVYSTKFWLRIGSCVGKQTGRMRSMWKKRIVILEWMLWLQSNQLLTFALPVNSTSFSRSKIAISFNRFDSLKSGCRVELLTFISCTFSSFAKLMSNAPSRTNDL